MLAMTNFMEEDEEIYLLIVYYRVGRNGAIMKYNILYKIKINYFNTAI